MSDLPSDSSKTSSSTSMSASLLSASALAVLSDEAAMRLAIEASRAARKSGNMPFGAALLDADSRLVHVAGNNQVSSGDFTGHAEMVLLREASMRLGREALRGTTVMASGEPCAMCSGTLFWAGVRRIVYAASQQDITDCLGGQILPINCGDVLAHSTNPPIVEGPFLRDEAVAVLRGS
jgi:tRNA(adenine34) deaminase